LKKDKKSSFRSKLLYPKFSFVILLSLSFLVRQQGEPHHFYDPQLIGLRHRVNISSAFKFIVTTSDIIYASSVNFVKISYKCKG